jgi:hypothetical protein
MDEAAAPVHPKRKDNRWRTGAEMCELQGRAKLHLFSDEGAAILG